MFAIYLGLRFVSLSTVNQARHIAPIGPDVDKTKFTSIVCKDPKAHSKSNKEKKRFADGSLFSRRRLEIAAPWNQGHVSRLSQIKGAVVQN